MGSNKKLERNFSLVLKLSHLNPYNAKETWRVEMFLGTPHLHSLSIHMVRFAIWYLGVELKTLKFVSINKGALKAISE